MSPILEISLWIVFCLWVIPLTWAVSNTVRSLPGLAKALIEWITTAPANLVAYIKHAPARYESYLAYRKLERENSALEDDYRTLQDELILQRALVAQAIATKAELELKIQKLTEEEEIAATESEHLLQLRGELDAHLLKLDALRNDLDDKEAAVQKAYTSKQVLIATHKADAAAKQVRKLLESDSVAKHTIRKMEEKVVQREARAYGGYFLEDRYVSFPSAAKAISRLSVVKLELDELQELLEAVELAASELHEVVRWAIAYEKVLLLQAKTADADAEFWEERFENVKQEGQEHLAEKAVRNRAGYADAAQEFYAILNASKICSAEFTQMHANFAQKEREIFNRIAEIKPSNPEESGNSEKNSDPQPGA